LYFIKTKIQKDHASLFLIFILIYFIGFLYGDLYATPFPVKGEIFDHEDQRIGTAHVYPQFVEIFDMQNQMTGKIGVMIHQGIAKLFLVGTDNQRSLVGHATGGKLFDHQNRLLGSYFWTPTYSFVYGLGGIRAGRVKCIAWPRVCAAGVAGYLLKLFEVKNEITPKSGGSGEILPK